MADIGTLRDGLQARLDTIDGLYAYDVEKGSERMPCAIVFPKPPTSGFFEATNCGGTYEFVIELHVALAGLLTKAQNRLDGYISPDTATSVQAAIRAEPTLGGAANNTTVHAFAAYGFSELNKVPTLMARIPVEVWV